METPNHIALLYELFKVHPSISTDTRNIVPGSIFFALRGESFDGNAFAREAVDKGAAHAVVDDREKAGEDSRFTHVDDALVALQQLANLHRRTLRIPVFAITGSNGKTTTKELLSRTLANRFNVSVTRGNLNNHIGVPLTLLAMTRDTEFGIVEMGASARGEIALLCEVAQPDYGLITNIGRAHLEGFGGAEGVVDGKGELYDYLNDHFGLAFFLKDDSLLREMVMARQNMLAKGYPSLESCDLPDNRYICVRYRDSIVKTHLVGDYNRFNISAAIAVGEYFEVNPREIGQTISAYIPDNNRSQRQQTEFNTLILDCYNANPSSMAAAIDNFTHEKSTLRRTMILGDMLELGDYAGDEHEKVLRAAIDSGASEIMLVGGLFADAAAKTGHEGQKPRVMTFASREKLEEYLKANRLKDRLVLVKGSRGIGLEKLVPML